MNGKLEAIISEMDRIIERIDGGYFSVPLDTETIVKLKEQREHIHKAAECEKNILSLRHEPKLKERCERALGNIQPMVDAATNLLAIIKHIEEQWMAAEIMGIGRELSKC